MWADGHEKHNTREETLQRNYEKFERPRKSLLRRLEARLRLWRNALYSSGSQKRKEKRRQKKQARRMQFLLQQGVPRERIHFVEHHLCHAASAYYGQGNREEKVLVLTCDAAGDDCCATVYIGQGEKLDRLAEVPKSESVAMIYALITYLLGFVPLEHEYKLMGLSPYAEGAREARQIRDFFHALFTLPVKDNPLIWKRTPGGVHSAEIGPMLKKGLEYKRFDHIAAGIQTFTEEFMLQWVRNALAVTHIPRLALAGGIFMNVKLNRLILELPEVESLFIFPSCGDESASIGAAWALYAQLCHDEGREARIPPPGPIYWGGSYGVEEALRQYKFHKPVKVTHYDDIELECARLLARGEVVARCKGRMEFGARALGNRSILADPSRWETVQVINAMIKQRDFWMPFAPSILAEYADRYIINPKRASAPYMILAFDSVRENRMLAATHPYDRTCRPQIVEKAWNPDYHRLLSHYRELTGNAAILNTSFNLHGFPIVYKPMEALEVFDKSGLQYLALENFLIEEIRE